MWPRHFLTAFMISTLTYLSRYFKHLYWTMSIECHWTYCINSVFGKDTDISFLGKWTCIFTQQCSIAYLIQANLLFIFCEKTCVQKCRMMILNNYLAQFSLCRVSCSASNSVNWKSLLDRSPEEVYIIISVALLPLSYLTYHFSLKLFSLAFSERCLSHYC